MALSYVQLGHVSTAPRKQWQNHAAHQWGYLIASAVLKMKLGLFLLMAQRISTAIVAIMLLVHLALLLRQPQPENGANGGHGEGLEEDRTPLVANGNGNRGQQPGYGS